MSENKLILEVKGLTKDYPGVRALDNVDFHVQKGETHVLVGENGAGKSTLVKILVGGVSPTSVEQMLIDGEPFIINSPRDAIRAGIAAIHQHFSLIPTMTICENIFLNREKTRGKVTVDFKEMKRATRELLEDLGVPLNPEWIVGQLSPGDQQIVEICKAISQKPKILLMDEPTAGLKHAEIRRLFQIVDKLKKMGVTILYISHRLEEVFEVGDRVTVFRNGKKVTEASLKELTHEELTRLIIGRDLEEKFPKESVDPGEVLLKLQGVENARTKVPLSNISFEVRRGEILGIYGILGSGKTELAHTLFGVSPATGGSIEIRGKKKTIKNPKEAINLKMGYLTEDRSTDGLIKALTVKQNQTIAALKRFSRFDYIIQSKERKESDYYIEKAGIVTPHRETMVDSLSGGNQQKVLLSKWLISQADILILNEPTRGIDVGSKVEMFRLVVEQVKSGKAVILLTSELDEAIGMSDRLLVMRNGRIVKEFSYKQFDKREVGKDDVLLLATQKDADDHTLEHAAGV